MQQIYRTPMPKCDLNFATLLKSHLRMGILLQICCMFSKTPFYKNTYGGLFLHWAVHNVLRGKKEARKLYINSPDAVFQNWCS